MKITFILGLSCCICLCTGKSRVFRQCVHQINNTNDKISFPGMIFNDRAKRRITERRKINGICIIHGKIPGDKALTLKINGTLFIVFNWLSIGGRTLAHRNWTNFGLIEFPILNYNVLSQYSNFMRNGPTGEIEVMLPGYEFNHFRIVFPKQDSNFTVSYTWSNITGVCKPLSDVVDVVSCTDGRNIHSTCTVKCKTGFLPSPFLYKIAGRRLKNRLPLMSTTCRGNAFKSPEWTPEVSSTEYDYNYFADNMFMQEFTIHEMQVSIYETDRNAPSDVHQWYEAVRLKIIPYFEYFDNTPTVLKSHKCVSLENIADICFQEDRIYVSDEFQGMWIDNCDYPTDYILQLYGEERDDGIDPDTIAFPNYILQLDAEEKLYFFVKLLELRTEKANFKDNGLPFFTRCWPRHHEDLYILVREQISPTKVKYIWDEFSNKFQMSSATNNCEFSSDSFNQKWFQEGGHEKNNSITILLTSSLSLEEQILQLNKSYKLEFFVRLDKLRKEEVEKTGHFIVDNRRVVTRCWEEKYENLHVTLHKQFSTILFKVERLWSEFWERFNQGCIANSKDCYGSECLQLQCYRRICDMISNGTSLIYAYKCASFKKRFATCIACRHGSTNLCQRTKASGK